MEFARRGPATAAVDEDVEGRRFLDPPSQPHGDAMLVIRDALLLQLQQYRLRQEIIMAELAKIDHAMALSSTSCHGVVAGDVKWTKLPSLPFGEKLMSHSRWPVSPEHWADVDCHHDLKEDGRQGGPESGIVRSAMQGRVGECSRPCCTGKKLDENATPEPDAQKLQQYNENVQDEESSQWELKEITMPVKKPKSTQKWTCTICHVETISERQLEEHCAGKKHRSNAAKLESRNKDVSQTAETTAEPSLCRGLKTCQLKWSCSACQANGTSEADLKEHLNSSTHQQNIEAKCYTESHFEHHCSGKKHQKKIEALQREGTEARLYTLKMENKEGSSDGSDSMNATRDKVVEQMTPCVSDVCNSLCGSETDRTDYFSGEEHLEKQKNFCEVCGLQCNSEKMLVLHFAGKKHLKKLKAKHATKGRLVGAVVNIDVEHP